MSFALSALHSSNQQLELPHTTSSTPRSCLLEIVGIGCLECVEGGQHFPYSFTVAAAVAIIAIMYFIESANPFIPVELYSNMLRKEKLCGSARCPMHGEFLNSIQIEHAHGLDARRILNSVQIELAHGLNSGAINGSR